MIAIDTNLLVYAHLPTAPVQQRARAAIQAAADQGRGWGFAVGCVAELYSVVTQDAPGGAASSSRLVAGFVAGLLEAGAEVWLPSLGFHERLMTAAEAHNISGRRIYDLQIGLTSLEAGATEIWTNDLEFLTVPGLRVVNPL